MAGLQPGQQPMILAGNEPLVLTGGFQACIVESGSLGLFSVETGNGASGRRQFLFNVGSNEMLFAAPDDSGRALVAVPREPSMVLPLAASDVASERYIQGIEKWCVNVARLLSVFQVPKEAKPVPALGSPETLEGKATY